MGLEDKIRDMAEALGLIGAGFATAAPSLSTDRFRRWLERGAHAGMSYLERHARQREDPRNLEPEARSIIVVAARYPVHPQPGSGFGALAAGDDYHAVVAGRLKHLAEGIRRLRPLRAARICVDSAPLPEREWAVRAGIGWLGRQGQVVRADAGCCLVLGELLVDIELEPTAQTADRCGDCRRCVAACPTQTIAPDRSVDARRCISYLTIEHKDAIPLELRPALGTALFGCDRCTAVCPWNEHGEKSELPELQPRSRPAADECLEMNAAQFRRHFKDTAVRRSGLERLQRNAAVALGNAGNLRARPLLEKTAANHPRSIVREHAAWALERLRHCG